MWKFLNAFGITDEASLKRVVTLIFSGVVALTINPFLVAKGMPPVSDATIGAFALIVSAFLVQSGVNSAAKKPPAGGAP